MAAQSTGWSVVRGDLVATTFQVSKERSVRAYSPVKQQFSFCHDCFGKMIDRLCLDLQATARKKVSDQTVMAFGLETTLKMLDSYVPQAILRGPKEPKREEKKSEKPDEAPEVVRFGLSTDEQIACIKKAHEIAVKWFTEQSDDLNGKKYWAAPVANILANNWQGNTELQCFAYKQLNLRKSKDPVAFTQADRDAFGVEAGAKVSDPTSLDCVAFAWLKTREMRAKEYIFHGKEYANKDLPKILESWGYVPVETPAPNDLVVYIDADGDFAHIGRFLVSGLVESKLGINQPYFHWHNIFDVPALYGNRVVFMRKS